MPLSKVEVAQMACTEVGLDPIGSFEDGSTQSVVLKAHIDTIIEDALSQHYWRFGCAQAVLNVLDATPAGRWSYAFQVPGGVLSVRALTVSDYPIDFEIYDDQIYCEADGTIDVILDAMYYVDVPKWKPYFTRFVVLKLASILASGVREDAEMSKLKETLADIQWRTAKNTDSKGRTTSRLRPTRITNSRLRRGGTSSGIRSNST